ncbi:MAG TPA: ATP-binding protein [Anaerolineae bacterium]
MEVVSDLLNVQVYRINNDLAELFFNPREDDLHVGETLTLRERDSGRSVVAQVIAFRSATYPSLMREQLDSLVGLDPAHSPVTETLEQQLRLAEELSGEDEMGNIKVALAKIRKTVPARNNGHARWEEWDGWIPARDVDIFRTEDHEIFANATRNKGHRLRLGRTLAGQDFFIEGQDLEKVNVITGVKGSGKSHLAKVVLLELINQGAPCIVFDINKEYIHLPKVEVDAQTGKTIRRGIVHLEAGGNFRLSVRQFGLAPLLTLLQRFGLPEVSSLHFENRLSRLWSEADALERRNGRQVPYIGLEQLIEMAEENEFGGGSNTSIVNHAIRSRLEAVRNTGIFARNPKEAASLGEAYRKIRDGGALVIDVSSLSNLAREGFVQAIIELVKDLCIWEIDHATHRFPFIFFEEAHLYVSKQSIDYIITRARHLGITSFFVTNMIHGVDEAVLRQADNLFLLRIPFEDDVRHVSRGAATDYETMMAFVRRLRQRHALVVGNVTSQFPLMFEVNPLEGVNTAGETRYFFRE